MDQGGLRRMKQKEGLEGNRIDERAMQYKWETMTVIYVCLGVF